MAAESQSIEERLSYLEEQNDGLKRVGRAALVLLLVLGAILVYEVWAPMSGITTRGLVLRDEADAQRAAVLIGPGGHVALVPADLQGRLPQLQSDANVGLQGLGVYDTKGRLRMLIGVTGEDEPVLAVVGPEGQLTWTPLKAAAKPQAPGGAAPMTPPAAPGAPEAATPPQAPVATPTP
ncbi:MAG: hypothetical protein HY319_18050 [Armatimonadetes bacterium]|nr:hypothetical protein [Armatimonadota bacterium]